MSEQPLVSIITPTYKHEKYILDCIRSVQAQQYTNWELLIINDGSPDNTEELVLKEIKNDPRIYYFKQQNIGIQRLGESYNKAFNLSKGEFIAILEGDDVWTSNKLKRQIKAFQEQPEAVLAWGSANSVNENLSEEIKLHPSTDSKHTQYYTNSPIPSILNLLFIENYIPALTILIRRNALEKIGGFIQSHNLPLVDLPTIMALSKLGTFIFDPELLGSWRIYPTQVTKMYPVEIIKGRYALSLNQYDSLSDEIRKSISISKKDIDSYFKFILLQAYARSGRYRLIRKEYQKARADYKKAIFFSGKLQFMWRLRALIGYVFSIFRLNVEGIARFMGRNTYS